MVFELVNEMQEGSGKKFDTYYLISTFNLIFQQLILNEFVKILAYE